MKFTPTPVDAMNNILVGTGICPTCKRLYQPRIGRVTYTLTDKGRDWLRADKEKRG